MPGQYLKLGHDHILPNPIGVYTEILTAFLNEP
jgi:hypothetical protein